MNVTIPVFPIVLLLIGLKLMGYISISWLWVFSPMWFPVAFIMPFLIIWLTLGIIYGFKVTKK
jgi:hypothetical protein